MPHRSETPGIVKSTFVVLRLPTSPEQKRADSALSVWPLRLTTTLPQTLPADVPVLVKLHAPAPKPFIVHEGSTLGSPHATNSKAIAAATE